jgi:primase-polymerase (primpol)-like protein
MTPRQLKKGWPYVNRYVNPPINNYLFPEIQNLPHYLAWVYSLIKETQEYAKIPINPRTWKAMEWSKHPELLVDFQTAWNAIQKRPQYGLGIVLQKRVMECVCTMTNPPEFQWMCTHPYEDPFTCIDLDNKHGDHRIWKIQQEIVDNLDTYTEWSPSGKGLHIWCKASFDARERGGRRWKDIEIYWAKRFMSLTFHPYRNVPVADCQTQLEQLMEYLDSLPYLRNSRNSDK